MTCTYSPTTPPMTVPTPAVRPSIRDRVTTKITLGPGTMINANEISAKASRWLAGGMPQPNHGIRVAGNAITAENRPTARRCGRPGPGSVADAARPGKRAVTGWLARAVPGGPALRAVPGGLALR